MKKREKEERLMKEVLMSRKLFFCFFVFLFLSLSLFPLVCYSPKLVVRLDGSELLLPLLLLLEEELASAERARCREREEAR